MHWSGESAPKLDAAALFRETNRSSLKYLCAIIQMTGLVRVVRVSGRHLSIPNYGATGQVRYAPAARPPLLPPPARLSFFAQISNPAHAGHMHQPTTDPYTVWPICRVGILRHRCSLKYRNTQCILCSLPKTLSHSH